MIKHVYRKSLGTVIAVSFSVIMLFHGYSIGNDATKNASRIVTTESQQQIVNETLIVGATDPTIPVPWSPEKPINPLTTLIATTEGFFMC